MKHTQTIQNVLGHLLGGLVHLLALTVLWGVVGLVLVIGSALLAFWLSNRQTRPATDTPRRRAEAEISGSPRRSSHEKLAFQKGTGSWWFATLAVIAAIGGFYAFESGILHGIWNVSSEAVGAGKYSPPLTPLRKLNVLGPSQGKQAYEPASLATPEAASTDTDIVDQPVDCPADGKLRTLDVAGSGDEIKIRTNGSALTISTSITGAHFSQCALGTNRCGDGVYADVMVIKNTTSIPITDLTCRNG